MDVEPRAPAYAVKSVDRVSYDLQAQNARAARKPPAALEVWATPLICVLDPSVGCHQRRAPPKCNTATLNWRPLVR